MPWRNIGRLADITLSRLGNAGDDTETTEVVLDGNAHVFPFQYVVRKGEYYLIESQ